ncbi:MAG: biotin/acetyl-CoA-carboxylase ligase [Rhizobiaceae bacterium]|jgi:BirA family biotin operon repressor/biotin-[acetyl-CoA-carboxylase] ligase|nr:biotin/acetyl-CoA-carboxylase ligase [Rhizobiaceae bacterium]
MRFQLAPSAIADGYRLEALDSVGSTNALALDRARSGDPGRLWVVSSRQENGRGRRGRPWATPQGNLAATLLVVGSFELRLAATLGFVAGLSLSDALGAAMPGGRVGMVADGAERGTCRFELKWPNDVIAGGAKLAGILLETTMLDGGRCGLAVGIGVNVVAHPEDLPYPATSLAGLGAEIGAEGLFHSLSEAWTENWRRWDEGRGLADVRVRWLSRAAGLGSPVSVRIDGNVVRGVFETIDEDCRFVIRTGGGPVRIAAGDVHFGAVASA